MAQWKDSTQRDADNDDDDDDDATAAEDDVKPAAIHVHVPVIHITHCSRLVATRRTVVFLGRNLTLFPVQFRRNNFRLVLN